MRMSLVIPAYNEEKYIGACLTARRTCGENSMARRLDRKKELHLVTALHFQVGSAELQ